MRVILVLIAGVALLTGFAIWGSAKSAVHEIEAACAFIVFVIALSGAVISEKLIQLRKEAEKQTILLAHIASNTRPPSPEQKSTLSSVPTASTSYMQEPKSNSIGVAVLAALGLLAVVVIIAIVSKK